MTLLKNDKFAYKKRKGVILGKKIFPLVYSKYLSSWTGPDRSRQVRTGSDMPPGLALAGPDMSERRFVHENVTFWI